MFAGDVGARSQYQKSVTVGHGHNDSGGEAEGIYVRKDHPATGTAAHSQAVEKESF